MSHSTNRSLGSMLFVLLMIYYVLSKGCCSQTVNLTRALISASIASSINHVKIKFNQEGCIQREQLILFTMVGYAWSKEYMLKGVE